MGFRFRKSLNFGIFRINLSKTGIGYSIGVPGARYTKLANGRTRTTLSVPNTGISYVEEGKNMLNFEKNEKIYNTENDIGLKVAKFLLQCFGLFAIALLVTSCFSYSQDEDTQICIFFVSLFLLAICRIIDEIWFKELVRSDYDKALSFFNNKDYENAIQLLTKQHLEFKEKKLLYDCYIAIENYESALELVETNDFENKREKLISIYAQMEKPKMIIKVLQKEYSDAERNELWAITLEGKCYFDLEKYDLALETLLRGPYKKTSMDGVMCHYRYLLGCCYQELGEKQKAIKQLNKVYAYDCEFEDIEERLELLTKTPN